MAKADVLDISKFFSKDHSFAAVKGELSNGDDFYLNLTFGDGENKVTYFISDFNAKESIKQMQVMQEYVEKSIEFVQKALSVPVKVDDVYPAVKWFDSLQQPTSVKPANKAAKKKKSAVK